MVRLPAVLDSWKTIRNDTVQALGDFPSDHLYFRHTHELMSVREPARQICDAGNALTGMLLDEVDNPPTPECLDEMKSYSSSFPARTGCGTSFFHRRKDGKAVVSIAGILLSYRDAIRRPASHAAGDATNG